MTITQASKWSVLYDLWLRSFFLPVVECCPRTSAPAELSSTSSSSTNQNPSFNTNPQPLDATSSVNNAGSYLESLSSSPALVTITMIAMTTTVTTTVTNSLPVTTTSMVGTTGGQGGSDTNVALIPGVVVGVVLAVVLVVVVVAIVMAVCLVRQRRKPSNQTYDVPLVALSAAGNSGNTAITLISNPNVVTSDEIKEVMSSGKEASTGGLYDYARPTDIESAMTECGPSTHDPAQHTPMYDTISDTPPVKVSIVHTHVK